ncbi:CHRD domain-containing protein [Planococcus halotolerans]|uniref:CHRD domain-containing protein n=1 Tax=Planococcus halotolerans TaxID=2233542 RepID=A0A365KUG0_9BACL|nr:CHRD domain-containing protein [Planococcus halotolerans]QHJ71338.1 CHRD domain-containing protein [Planococcus halotolerans]RAZ76806.1 CHRD domain-containing protein [Planococcus halotolerans]
MKKILVLLLVSVLAATGFAGAVFAAHEGLEFNVELTPEQEVGDVTSDATGQAHFKVSEDGESLEYTVSASNLNSTLAGHLHSGSAGENGPVELFLFENEEPMDYNGEVATGTLNADDLVGDMTWQDFSMALVAGDIYVNLHTEEYPDGEIRDQLVAEGDEMADTASNGPLFTMVGLFAILMGGILLIGRRQKATA